MRGPCDHCVDRDRQRARLGARVARLERRIRQLTAAGNLMVEESAGMRDEYNDLDNAVAIWRQLTEKR